MYVCMYVCMCVSMYVCMYACMYVCMYIRMYVHTCFVLTNPSIPSSRCKHCINFDLFKFCFMRGGTQGFPLVNPLNSVFFKFMMQITS